MLFMVHAGTLLLFPAAAAWAWRRGGPRTLWTMTAGTVAAGFVLALIAASEAGGNRLASTHGYAHIAARVVRLVSLVWVLPVVASAVSVHAAAPRIRPGMVIPLALGVGLAAAVAGTMIAIYAPM